MDLSNITCDTIDSFLENIKKIMENLYKKRINMIQVSKKFCYDCYKENKKYEEYVSTSDQIKHSIYHSYLLLMSEKIKLICENKIKSEINENLYLIDLDIRSIWSELNYYERILYLRQNEYKKTNFEEFVNRNIKKIIENKKRINKWKGIDDIIKILIKNDKDEVLTIQQFSRKVIDCSILDKWAINKEYMSRNIEEKVNKVLKDNKSDIVVDYEISAEEYQNKELSEQDYLTFDSYLYEIQEHSTFFMYEVCEEICKLLSLDEEFECDLRCSNNNSRLWENVSKFLLKNMGNIVKIEILNDYNKILKDMFPKYLNMIILEYLNFK